MRRLLAVLTHAALRLVIAFMMAAGGAALVAVVFVMRPPSDGAEWIVPIRQTALAIGFTFLGAAVIALGVLPSRRELIRVAVDPSERALPGSVLPLLAGLAGVSAWQFPMVLAWWDESRKLLEQLTAGERDPLGLWIIPAAMVSAPPLIATLAVVLFILTAMAVAVARPPLAVRVLRAGVLLQSGLVIGSTLALPPIRGLAARGLALAASGPDAGVLAAMTEALARQDFFATGLLSRFQWILGGYVLATLATWYGQSLRDAAGDALPSLNKSECPVDSGSLSGENRFRRASHRLAPNAFRKFADVRFPLYFPRGIGTYAGNATTFPDPTPKTARPSAPPRRALGRPPPGFSTRGSDWWARRACRCCHAAAGANRACHCPTCCRLLRFTSCRVPAPWPAEAVMAAAFCHIVCERPAEAIKALDQLLVAAPPGFAGWTIPIEPFFTALRAEPSFQAVLSRLSERARIALTLFHPFFTLPSRLQRVRSPILFS